MSHELGLAAWEAFLKDAHVVYRYGGGVYTRSGDNYRPDLYLLNGLRVVGEPVPRNDIWVDVQPNFDPVRFVPADVAGFLSRGKRSLLLLYGYPEQVPDIRLVRAVDGGWEVLSLSSLAGQAADLGAMVDAKMWISPGGRTQGWVRPATAFQDPNARTANEQQTWRQQPANRSKEPVAANQNGVVAGLTAVGVLSLVCLCLVMFAMLSNDLLSRSADNASVERAAAVGAVRATATLHIITGAAATLEENTETPQPAAATDQPEASATPVPASVTPVPASATPTRASATPTKIVEAAIVPGSAVGLVFERVNLRDGPGEAYAVVGVVTDDETIEIVGRTEEGGWLEVDAGGRRGWLGLSVVHLPDGFVLSRVPVSQNAPPVLAQPAPLPTTASVATSTAPAPATSTPQPAAPTPGGGNDGGDSPGGSCCKICRKGKACGDTCINRSYTCHVGPGCACNAMIDPGELLAMQWGYPAALASSSMSEAACHVDSLEWPLFPVGIVND